MKIKMESDTQDEVKVEKIIKKEDIDPIAEKMDKVIQKSQKILKQQSTDFQDEDVSYQEQQKYSDSFVIFTIIQIIIVLILGVYHLYSFRNFLIAHKVINKTN
jgi:hypothetical protein